MKYTVSTAMGLVHTEDFRSACRVLRMELERKKKEIEKEMKEQERLKRQMLQWIDENFKTVGV